MFSKVSGLRGPALKAHILEVASQLFYSKGIRAVGVDEIVERAQITRATLYRHFASKDDLILAYLTERSARSLEELSDIAVWSDAPPTRAKRVFEALEAKLTSPGFRGCAFLLAVSEITEHPDARKVAEDFKRATREHIYQLLLPLGCANALADQLALVYEGAFATALLRPDSGPAAKALECASILIEVAVINEKSLTDIKRRNGDIDQRLHSS